ncbi:MAG: hypothetical protein RUMPE_00799 [Eubacteriales bacterium SKADARSKE-1]|nr:hypothetical protein [Eubacteriales bacterium SKADARSKE-1]
MLRFEPKVNSNKAICIRIDSDKLEMIDKIAIENNMSRNKIISQCIDFALENLEKSST